MDRFDRRLRAELHREFDSQAVDTPPAHRARYGRLGRRQPPMRAMALVTAAFAIGILVGLVYEGRAIISVGPGHQLGALPSGTPPAPATGTASSPASVSSTSPSASATATRRPSPTSPPGASPVPTAARPSLNDDFEADQVGANPPRGWRAGDGQWAGVVSSGGGHAVRHGTAQALGHLVTGSPQWTDYAVSADVRTDLLDLGFAGVAGRYQDPGDDYECGVAVGGQLDLWVVHGGDREVLDSSGISLDLAGDHNVRLEMRGSTITCALDGTVLLRATDTTFSAGSIALVASTGEAAEFDNVRVSG